MISFHSVFFLSRRQSWYLVINANISIFSEKTQKLLLHVPSEESRLPRFRPNLTSQIRLEYSKDIEKILIIKLDIIITI